MAVHLVFTIIVEPLIVDSPKLGQCHSIIYLSTTDMTYGPSLIPTIHSELHKDEKLSTKNKSPKFMSSPKCPLFRGPTVYFLCTFCRMALRFTVRVMK